ncbi:MAG: PQQ-binding-like beta-propeller repeat protein [Coxiellaceae bacterium]|nr:MAG: PQQ-binding-like beta-propeller repeat protein [Coxiellaceae bacterium]
MVGRFQKPSLPEFTPTVQVNKLWETSIGNGTGGQYLQLPPSVQGNTVYAVSYKNKVAAVDANTGNRLWEANLKKRL